MDDEPAFSARVATETIFESIPNDEPGCSVAVNVDGEVVFAEAWGAAVLDPLEAFTPLTVVDIASTSKQFTAIAVGELVLSEEVDLGDPVGEYVAGLPGWGDRVTIAELITHMSGIPDYIELLQDDGVGLLEPADQADAMELLTDVTLDADPGTVFNYSNSNYILLAEVVANASGRTLPTFLRDEVFDPGGVNASMAPALRSPGKAESYEADGGWQIADSPWTQFGDGAVHTTPSELVSWAGFYWEDTDRGESFARLRGEVSTDAGDGSRYSLGIEITEASGETLLSHAGSWSGFETQFLVAPERRSAVAITCNSPHVTVETDGLDATILDLWTPST